MGVALSVCRDPELAADAVQDGFAAFRRAEGYRGDAAVTTWLHRVVVNACLDRLRRARPTDSLDELDERASTRLPSRPDGTAQVDTRLLVQDALAALPEPQRLVLVLADMHGVPVAEAARMLGVAEGTVKSRAVVAAPPWPPSCVREPQTVPARQMTKGHRAPGRTAPQRAQEVRHDAGPAAPRRGARRRARPRPARRPADR
ncbi:sigma-70 family RNA polymerase sigma factor [Janibacter melonis]|uniref:sigma-70 family RNA polymerase sigma factor n=1 Tax=Janibacter melonis TaxID=262209 RepID=UPI0027DA8FBF|nr:sigma-70 family RNA polymerase sigma factor [Janibacter melonis]